MESKITEKQNDVAISNLKKGLDSSWDTFLYGNKEYNIKPGNIRVYGTIAGQREVLKNRMAIKEQFNGQQYER